MPTQMQGAQMPAPASWPKYAPPFGTPQMPHTPQMWGQAPAHSQYASPPHGQYYGGYNPYGAPPANPQGHTFDAQEICIVPDEKVNVNKLVVAARGFRCMLKAVDGLPAKLTDLTKEEARQGRHARPTCEDSR